MAAKAAHPASGNSNGQAELEGLIHVAADSRQQRIGLNHPMAYTAYQAPAPERAQAAQAAARALREAAGEREQPLGRKGHGQREAEAPLRETER
jgi:hypothetical protein